MTTEMPKRFDKKLAEILGRLSPGDILDIPGVYVPVSEHLSERVFEELREEDALSFLDQPGAVMRRPPDFMADAYDRLCESNLRLRIPPDARPRGTGVACPVCGRGCGEMRREAIEIQPRDGWRCYRPGRTFWVHDDRACISDVERGACQEGDVDQG